MILSFNYTAAVEDETLELFHLLFLLIILVNILSILYYLFNVWIDIRVGKFDTNVLKIHQFIYITCPISSIAIIIQKCFIITANPDGYDFDNGTFQVLHYLRTATVFPGLVCLMAFVIERFCATFFLKDYEKRSRCWIGLIIGIGLYTISGLLAYTLAIVATSIYHTVFLLVLNSTSCMGNILNYKINRRYYKACQRSFDGTYSLAERYQISDNIHFSFFFNRFASSIFFFTILCPMLMLAASLDISNFWKNLFITLFELSFSVYTIFTPYVIYKFNMKWQQEFKKVFGGVMACFQKKRIEATESLSGVRNVPLMNTFGIQMNIAVKQQPDAYFDQLHSTWDVRI